MFTIPKASTARAALLAAAVALFASHAAMAAHPKEMSYWADAQSASRATGNGSQVASRAGDRSYGGAAQVASLAGYGDRNAHEQLG